jgi:hypothetical protein
MEEREDRDKPPRPVDIFGLCDRWAIITLYYCGFTNALSTMFKMWMKNEIVFSKDI